MAVVPDDDDHGQLGTYDILSVLPDKFARFLFEFHAHWFESLDLPHLPADRSDFDVHGALLDDKVQNKWHTQKHLHFNLDITIMLIKRIITIIYIISQIWEIYDMN